MKDLYLADSLGKLKARANCKIPTKRKFQEYVTMLIHYNKEAKWARMKGDEELQFVYLHRYYLIFCHIKSFDKFKEKGKIDSKLKDQINVNMVEYERILNKLIQRYKEKQTKVTTLMTPVSTKSVALEKETSVENSKSTKKTIDCRELFRILKIQTQTNCLVLDCRHEEDFEYCHINGACVINVPEDKMKKGFSAVKVGSILSRSAQGLWANRTMVDVLVLLDWNSTEKTLDPNSAIYHLRDSILERDPNTTYKSPPLILEGGFEMFYTAFPYIVTNILAEIRPPNNQPKLIMFQSTCEPPEKYSTGKWCTNEES